MKKCSIFFCSILLVQFVTISCKASNEIQNVNLQSIPINPNSFPVNNNDGDLNWSSTKLRKLCIGIGFIATAFDEVGGEEKRVFINTLKSKAQQKMVQDVLTIIQMSMNNTVPENVSREHYYSTIAPLVSPVIHRNSYVVDTVEKDIEGKETIGVIVFCDINVVCESIAVSSCQLLRESENVDIGLANKIKEQIKISFTMTQIRLALSNRE